MYFEPWKMPPILWGVGSPHKKGGDFMDKMSKMCLEREIKRIENSFAVKQNFEPDEFRYFLYLEKNRTFGVLAFPKNNDPAKIKFRYNAPVLIELTIHEYFEYSYSFYGGNLQYWNKSNG